MENDIFVSGLIARLDKFNPPAKSEQSAKSISSTPLVVRLESFLNSIDDDEKQNGIPFDRIRKRLKGVSNKTNAHAAELSEALRTLGWFRVRSWHNGRESFRALWFPPMFEDNSDANKRN